MSEMNVSWRSFLFHNFFFFHCIVVNNLWNRLVQCIFLFCQNCLYLQFKIFWTCQAQLNSLHFDFNWLYSELKQHFTHLFLRWVHLLMHLLILQSSPNERSRCFLSYANEREKGLNFLESRPKYGQKDNYLHDLEERRATKSAQNYGFATEGAEECEKIFQIKIAISVIFRCIPDVWLPNHCLFSINIGAYLFRTFVSGQK